MVLVVVIIADILMVAMGIAVIAVESDTPANSAFSLRRPLFLAAFERETAIRERIGARWRGAVVLPFRSGGTVHSCRGRPLAPLNETRLKRRDERVWCRWKNDNVA